MRNIENTYRDPLEIVWIHAARELGMEIRRDEMAFASWNGDGVLTIGTPETLDPDDCLAQMIFHEICHWLVEGDEAFGREDWGLVYDNPKHIVHEQACLRLQAALADQVGLRKFFSSTTDFREYFDCLPDNPLQLSPDKNGALAAVEEQAIVLAIAGWERANRSMVHEILEQALYRTREVANVVAGIAAADSIWTVDR